VPVVVIQDIMVCLIIAFPNLVSGGLVKKAEIDTSDIKIEAPKVDYGTPQSPGGGPSAPAEDPMEAVRRALEQEQKKK
jgi:GntP family gluconate:H+ symporter